MPMVKIDRGGERIYNNIRLMNNSHSKVGFPEEKSVNKGSYDTDNREVSVDMSEIATIAYNNEFVPTKGEVPVTRPFMLPALYNNKTEIVAAATEVYKSVIWGMMGTRQALSKLGSLHVEQIRKEILDGDHAENTARTLKMKFPITKPLIHTKQMYNSVQHVEVIKDLLA